jgi:dihydroflavonol-4-reductase
LKALVTGGTGFVGSHIVRVLNEAGHSARVLHRKSSKLDALEGLTYESALGDILDDAALREACAGCDWVFHVAAVADYWRADKAKMYEANVEGTRKVLAAARDAGVKRVVFTSSAAAIGNIDNIHPADEHTTFNLPPESWPYGHSKMLAEAVAQEAVQAGQEVVITNPVIIIGPGDLNMISGSYITQVKRFGWLVPITSGSCAVIDVRDVARMHLAAAEHGRNGERYILGSVNYSYKEWFGMIADVVGTRHPFIVVPNFLLPIGAMIISLVRRLGINTPIDSDQIRLGAYHMNFNPAKGWAELGKPQIDMRQSIRDTYDWYRAHGYIK